MTMRAKKLAERQAANVVANQKGRPSRQVKHNDASALDQSSRTLSSKERAKMMQAKLQRSQWTRCRSPTCAVDVIGAV